VTFLLLTNAGAGSADRRRVDGAVKVLETGGAVEVADLDAVTDLDQLLDRRRDRRLVVAGGDGTLHRTVAALSRRGELGDAVGLIPLGTGNDFARSVGLPLDEAAAAEVVLHGRAQPVDLVMDDLGTIAVNNIHVGVGAEASRRAASWKEHFGRLGRLGYGLGLLQASFTHPFRLDVEVGGERLAGRDRPVLEVSVGNGATVGGGVPLNPGADPTDGKLDVIVSFAAGLPRRISFGVDVLRGQQRSRPDVVQRSCDAVTITGDPFFTSVDGEIYGPVSRRTWRLERGALQVVLGR
jgi:YegS/Rv2252/BmrU family lipid kinase